MIRKATKEDTQRILEIYEIAKAFMYSYGNTKQWVNGYPGIEEIEEDLAADNLYVLYDEKSVYGTFFLHIGEDPAYGEVDGTWLSDEPYLVIHRVASDQTHRGIMKDVLEFAKTVRKHVKVDTHEDNLPMQHVLEKNGLSKRGIIHLTETGAPRVAYEIVYE